MFSASAASSQGRHTGKDCTPSEKGVLKACLETPGTTPPAQNTQPTGDHAFLGTTVLDTPRCSSPIRKTHLHMPLCRCRGAHQSPGAPPAECLHQQQTARGAGLTVQSACARCSRSSGSGGWRTLVPVDIDGVCSGNGDVVEQAEAVGAVRVVGTGDHTHRPRVVPRRPHRAECILRLRMRVQPGAARRKVLHTQTVRNPRNNTF
jgi:hypothetical protein